TSSTAGVRWWTPALAAPAESRAADRHRDGGLAGLDDRQADMALQAVAITRHASAAHDQHVGAVLAAQLGRDLGHAAEGARFVGEGGHARANGAVAGHAGGRREAG